MPARFATRSSRTGIARRTRGALVASAAAVALTAGLAPAPAQAQPQLGSISPEQLANDGLGTVLTPESLSQLLYFGNLPGSSGSSMMGLAHAVGFSPNLFAGDPPVAPEPNPNITETKVISKTVDGRYEQWLIDSHRMQRGITVEVYRAPDGGAAAPSLYMLDGVGSELPSGFMQWGAAEQFADQNVNLIIPTGGQGSMWADWNEPDPALGISKWESFITEDLPALVETELGTNGRRGIGGISMGAGAAVTIATRHPELYQAVFGVSGCYSTDALGQILTSFTVESRGADVTNMWGEPGNEQWAAHDAMIHAEALRDKAIYLSSATGVAAPGDWDDYNQDPADFVAGMALEQATDRCTWDADRRLDELGIDAEVVHRPVGMHNWSYFAPEIPRAWESVRGALQ